MSHDVDINKVNSSGRWWHGYTPLCAASDKCHVKIVKALLNDPRIDLNQLSWPLCVACSNGYDQIVQLLLNAGANPKDLPRPLGCRSDRTPLRSTDRTPLPLAVENKRYDVIELLLQWRAPDGDKIDPNKFAPLVTVCRYGHIKTVQLFLDAGASVNAVDDKSGSSALTMACHIKHYNIVDLLLNVPDIDVNHRTPDGNTALMYASKDGKTEIVQLLLLKGAEPNYVDCEGNTALIKACSRRERKTEIVNILLNMGAALNHFNNKGKTALIIACMRGQRNIPMICNLLSKGADPNHIDNNGYTALYYSMTSCYSENNQKMTNILLEDARVPSKQKSIYLTLFCACQYGRDKVVERLMQVPGIDLNARDRLGLTPLMIATVHKEKSLVQMLMADRRVEYPPPVSLTALQFADIMGVKSMEDQIRQRIRQRQDENKCVLALVMERKNRERLDRGEMGVPQDILRDGISPNL